MVKRNPDGSVTCPNCKKQYFPVLGERKHPDMCIQDEFPNAKPFEREQLLTALCSDKCWDEYLGVGPDEEVFVPDQYYRG